MDNRVYIIHKATIVQNGLERILTGYFKCLTICFNGLQDFLSSDERFNNPSIVFIENSLAESKEYKTWLFESGNVSAFHIADKTSPDQPPEENQIISIYDTPERIFEKVKMAFPIPIPSSQIADDLTPRETEVLRLVALGNSNKEIADKLFVSVHTVMSHRKNITEKLGIKSISGLTVYAIINDLIDTTSLDVFDLI
jgi:DNA-binding CsgD family transcriptional regulator